MSFSSVNARQQQQPYRSASPAYDSSPGPSSGAATPANGSFGLASSVSSLWGGLVRHFSISDDPSPSSSYRSRTFPSDGAHSPPHHHDPRRTPSPRTMRGPPPLEPLQLRGFAPDTPAAARLLTPGVAEEIRTMVPARLSLVDEWRLIYSLEQDGASLATLYDKCSAFRGKRVGYVLVVRDCEGGVSIPPSPLFPPTSTNIPSPPDLRRLPLRPPPPSPQVLWHRRVLPLEGLDPHLPPTPALDRHHAPRRPNNNHPLGRVVVAQHPLQGIPLQRRQRVLYAVRVPFSQRRRGRRALWAVARRRPGQGHQLAVRDVRQRAAERRGGQVWGLGRRGLGCRGVMPAGLRSLLGSVTEKETQKIESMGCSAWGRSVGGDGMLGFAHTHTRRRCFLVSQSVGGVDIRVKARPFNIPNSTQQLVDPVRYKSSPALLETSLQRPNSPFTDPSQHTCHNDATAA